MTPSLTEAYRRRIAQGDLADDPGQVAAVQRLQDMVERLAASRPRLFGRGEAVRGLYLWGAVGLPEAKGGAQSHHRQGGG